MCYNCGCHNPHDDMGNQDNITWELIAQMAKGYKVPDVDLKEGIYQYLSSANSPTNPVLEEMFNKAAIAWGQSIPDAKKNTLEMLHQELHH